MGFYVFILLFCRERVSHVSFLIAFEVYKFVCKEVKRFTR